MLETYLGSDAGQRVLTGQIDRNVFQTMHAVIWLCDLRGFSTVANEVEHDEFVEILDAHLELMARPVLEHGGQILKFLGDGFLATFELDEGRANTACDDTIRALDALRAQAPAFNATRRSAGKRTLDFGVALHVGDVLFGNIGTRERLDFTVVGTAVNEASRIERLCKPLGQQVLMSREFEAHAHASRHRMVPLGEHALHGICAAQALFTMAPLNAA